MTVAVAVVVVLAFVAVGVLIAWPALHGPEPDAQAAAGATQEERRQVEEDLERTLAAIKEIEFDRASGHLSDEDFRALDADERARAVELLRRRDDLGGGVPADGERP
jgi:hypothetical protein